MSTIYLLTINLGLRIVGILQPATLGQSYLSTLTGYAGVPPYVWSISGALPDGITVTTDSNNDYVFSGTPIEAGTFPIVVTIMDSEGRSVSRSFEILSQALPLTISGHLPNGTVGGTAAYSYTLGGGYGALVVTVYSGALPAGASISTAGAVSGTYTTGGSYSWVLQVEDSLGYKTHLSDSNVVAWATLAKTGALTDAYVGDPVGGSITLSGGDGTYTVDASPVSGTRPPGNGLALVGAVYSDSSGAITTAGTYTWTERFHSGDGQSLDVPCSIVSTLVSYTTLNPSDKSAGVVLSGGDLIATSSYTSAGAVRSVQSITGKKYFEGVFTAAPSGGATIAIGVAKSTATITGPVGYSSSDGWMYWGANPGAGCRSGGVTAFADSSVQGDRFGFACDQAAGKLWIRKNNGAWFGGGDPASGTSPTFSGLTGTLMACACPWAGSHVIMMAFDPATWVDSAPSGFTGIMA